jgi:pimeloyl-ACP methyl ester carboxylesterase
MTLAHERRGSGEPLVLIHGTGSRRQMWDPVLPLLEPHRDVLAVDLPGFGASPPLPGEPAVSPERYAEAVAGLLDELGLESAHAAGNSLGGAVALELARMGRARSATALSPIGFWTRREAEFCRASIVVSARVSRALGPLVPALARSAVARTVFTSQLVAHPWRMEPEGYAEDVRNLAGSPGLRAALDGYRHWRFSRPEELGCPVTIAWGQHDRLLLPRQHDRARGVLPAARHVTLAGCGHVPTYDDPEQVARVLLEGSAA